MRACAARARVAAEERGEDDVECLYSSSAHPVELREEEMRRMAHLNLCTLYAANSPVCIRTHSDEVH